MERIDIEDAVDHVIAKLLQIHPIHVHLKSRLYEDLSISEWAFDDLRAGLASRFNLAIPKPGELDQAETVRDVVDYIAARLGGRPDPSEAERWSAI